MMRMQTFMGVFALAFLFASMEFCSQPPGELKVMDKVIGKGEMAVKGDTVGVYYTGWLYTNGRRGRKFDSSVDKSFEFKLGGGEVIEGWDRGVEGMRVGGNRELIIPPQLGYGAPGNPPDIPPNATLDFEVQLVSVRK